MNLFLVSDGREYSYEDLYRFALHRTNLSSQIRVPENEPFKVFSKLVSSLLYGRSCEIIDGELADSELFTLGIETTKNEFESSDVQPVFASMDDLITALVAGRVENTIALYTSGTSGRPKKVDHPINSLLKTAKVSKRHADDVWALAYNPTHMAGIQVFFQALINKNTIVNVFGTKVVAFGELEHRYGINRISATPTFYRTFLSMDSGPWPRFLSVSSGGEKLDDQLREKLAKAFPAAHIYNIYASTEAGALFQAEGNIFSIPEHLKQKVRISDTGEILIHLSMLGKSESIKSENGWYHTGDVVEPLDSNKFRMKSRLSEMINVGGNKVDPHEIEELITSYDFIKDVRVFGKKNSVVGEIVAAEVVLGENLDSPDKAVEEIESRLRQVLQPYKLPRLIRIVPALGTTRTGKKVRS